MYLEQVMKVAVNMIVKIVVKWAVLVLIIFIVNYYSCRTVLVPTNAPRKPDLSAPSNGWDCRSDWHIHINLFKPLVSWLHKSITHSFAHFLHLAQFSFSSFQFTWVLSPLPPCRAPRRFAMDFVHSSNTCILIWPATLAFSACLLFAGYLQINKSNWQKGDKV